MSHDPGGKVRLPLSDDVRGWAEFSECQRYRHMLGREWGGQVCGNYVLWIGMNPSTADANVDDPTMSKVRKFTARFGYYGYVMCNVMDYRATDPASLLDVEPCSKDNLPMILKYAQSASLTVVCYGRLHRTLGRYARRVQAALRADGVRLKCLGTNADGSPKHPLYVRDDTPLVDFEG